MNALADTIVSPVTAPGSAGVAIVRLSGPKSFSLLQKVAPDGASRALSSPRTLVYCEILDTASSDATVLDRGLVVCFAAGSSFTGEEVAELHLHGSPFIVRRIVSNLISLGARMSEPGEFTRRAFENGQLDLSQAEAVADVVAAETEAQARAAQEQLGGRLRNAISDLGEPLRDFLAEVEATIDFPEEDIEPLAFARWAEELAKSVATLQRLLGTYRTGRLYRDGALVVLAGLPNAGKSTLLNRLLGEERAIVTPVPGTTRDTIEERISLNGLLVRLVDTAGIGDEDARSIDVVEELGRQRSWKLIEQAEVVLFLYDVNSDPSSLAEKLRPFRSKVILVPNKIDLARTPPVIPEFENSPLPISAATGEGVPVLQHAIIERLGGAPSFAEGVIITTERHASALRLALEELQLAHGISMSHGAAEIVALHVRSALGALQEIVGVTTTEDLLGRIFSRFCIGK